MIKTLRLTFRGWEVQILRPVLVTLASAFVLFLASLLLRPVRAFFFPDVARYPLYCTAEAYGERDGSISVEFFIVNPTASNLTWEDLRNDLVGQGPGATPDLMLKYRNPAAEPEVTVRPDEHFNQGKGTVHARVVKNDVTITIHSIDAHAILKVAISAAGLAGPRADVSARTRERVPFKFDHYESACYSR